MNNIEKPEVKHVTFYRNEGNYNWLKQSEVSAQYVFRFPHLTSEEVKEKGLTYSFLVDLDKDYDFSPESYTAYELADELRNIYDSYWIHSGKGEIKRVFDYLESIEEDQEKLRHQYEIEYAKYKIQFWENKLEKLTK
ncbi:hypothetical protein FZC83_02030 [Rossellomorea marisflavi]|uniref:Uncharacterized protein n=1 Tax=Rossellomorea marisflavi TaxID=189381 RepID=A0A5D4S2P0_9BACI|nr:hypothetical protein [Rossellomorea marisflavi]TYS56374.1 hypothetical protein FZC83_02030 [Rossellomorea marisflavi]